MIIFNATGFLYLVPFDLLQGMAGAAGTFSFYLFKFFILRFK